jgi:hypothetical protein
MAKRHADVELLDGESLPDIHNRARRVHGPGRVRITKHADGTVSVKVLYGCSIRYCN